MELIQKPTATAGQIVKDLEQIAAKSPDIFLDYSNDDGNDMFVEGIKLQKGVAILETTGKESRAATVEELLAMFRMLDASVAVVLQDGWEMLNFESFADGSIIRYDEEDGYCQFALDTDVRLVTTQQIEAEVKKIDEEGLLDYKVVPVLSHGNGLMVHRVNCLREHYGKLCLCYVKDEEKDSITVGELLEGFPYCAEFMVCLNGKYYTVEVGEKGIFFVHKKGEKRYLCLNLGEVVFNPMEDLVM